VFDTLYIHKFQLQSVKLVLVVFVGITDLVCKRRDQNVGQSRNSSVVVKTWDQVAKFRCSEQANK